MDHFDDNKAAVPEPADKAISFEYSPFTELQLREITRSLREGEAAAASRARNLPLPPAPEAEAEAEGIRRRWLFDAE